MPVPAVVGYVAAGVVAGLLAIIQHGTFMSTLQQAGNLVWIGRKSSYHPRLYLMAWTRPTGPPQGFVPGVCERLEPYLASQMVGQELALQQLADAVCDHVGSANPAKPLVLSAHGPPGVGKSLAHLLMARALYNPDAGPDMQCPGMDCPGYKVGPLECRASIAVGAQCAASWHTVAGAAGGDARMQLLAMYRGRVHRPGTPLQCSPGDSCTGS